MQTQTNPSTSPERDGSESSAPTQDVPIRHKQVATPEQVGTYGGRYFEPAVDIYETDEALTLRADLPGAASEDIRTDLENSLLTVTARVKPVDGRWKPLHREYEVGHYTRQFRLGQQIDQGRITAELKDGVLTLTLPKADAARPRRIQVKAG